MPQADPEVGATTLQKPSTQCLHQDFQLEVEGAKVGKQKDIMSYENFKIKLENTERLPPKGQEEGKSC